MDVSLPQPALVDRAGWDAIESHRRRLATAIAGGDAPLVIGSAKELVESVARVAAASAGGQVAASNADFSVVVNAAHKALDRQAGRGITRQSDVRAIADYARKMVMSLSQLRNEWGTGHGRGEVRSMEAELHTMAAHSALLWCRWALTRLDHIVRGEPQLLIEMLRSANVSRRELADRLGAVVLPEQPQDVQRALGAAFGRRTARGTFVAREAGIDPPAGSDDLSAWPEHYRIGAAEGLATTESGSMTLSLDWLPLLAGLLRPLPPGATRSFLSGLAETVRTAGTPSSMEVEDLWELSQAILRADLPDAADALKRLSDAINPIEDDDLPGEQPAATDE